VLSGRLAFHLLANELDSFGKGAGALLQIL
jgi:hypothetical protein